MNRGVTGDIQHLRSKPSKCDQLVSCCSLLTIITCSILALLFLTTLIILTTNENYCRNAVSSRLRAGKNSSLADPNRPAALSPEADSSFNCSQACVGVLIENGSVVPLPAEYFCTNASSTLDTQASLRLFRPGNRSVRVLGTKLLLKLFKHNTSQTQNLLSSTSKLNYSVVHILYDFDHEDEMKSITLNINEEFLSVVFSLGIVLLIVL